MDMNHGIVIQSNHKIICLYILYFRQIDIEIIWIDPQKTDERIKYS